MKRFSKPLIAVIVTLIVALIAGMVSAIWIIMTPLTTETGSTFRPDNIEEKVTISFNYGEFSEIAGYPANQEAHAPIEAIAGRDVTLPTADELTKEGEPYKPAGYGLSAWESNNGVRYEPGHSYSFEADVTMTPVWAKIVTVTFISNGSQNLTREIDIEAGASFSDTLAYKSAAWPEDMEKPNRPSGKTFDSWYDETGTPYTENSTFSNDTTLTARFTISSSNFDVVYFGLVGSAGNTSSPMSLAGWDYIGNASLLQFIQDKDHLYTASGVQNDTTGTYTKFEQDIYLFSGDEFAIIGTQEEYSTGGPKFERPTSTTLPLQQKYTGRDTSYTRSLPTGDFKPDSTGSNFIVQNSHGYRITMYIHAKKSASGHNWENTANITITEIALSSPVTNQAPVIYLRSSMNNWLNDWHWTGFKPTSEKVYTDSVYNFGTPTRSGTTYTYTMEVTLQNDPGKDTMTEFECQAYVANELTWLNLYFDKVSTKPSSSPNGQLVSSSNAVTRNGSNIKITEPGIWKIELVVGLSSSHKLQRSGQSPTNYYYTVSKVSKTVTFDYGDYTGSTPPAQQVVKENTQLTLPGAPTWAGHKFLGWKASGETDADDPHQQGTEYAVTKDVTFTAQWKELKTVTYTDPEFPDRVTTHKYVEDKEVADYTAPDPATWPVGRKFAGWHIDPTLGTLYTGTPITEDTTLYAKWDYIEYTVKFASAINDATLKNMPEKDAEGKPYTVSLQEGHTTLDLTKIAPPTLTGYTFAHWTYGATINLSTFTLTEDDVKGMVEGSTELTLTAQWTAITYKIVFDPNKPANTKYEVGGLSEKDTVYVTRKEGNDSIRLPLGAKRIGENQYEDGVELRGYNFMGWNLKNERGDDWLYDPEALPDSSYSAHSPFNATALLDTEMIEKFAVADAEGNYTITFYAQWLNLDVLNVGQHIVSFNLNSYGGVVYPKGEEQEYHGYNWSDWDDKVQTDGDDITIPAAPHWAGFKFEYWDYRDYAYILGHSARYQYSANDNFTVDKNDGPQITFDAIWSPIEYTVEFNMNKAFLQGAGAVDPVITGFGGESISMNRLGSVILESVNTKGFTFTGWQIDTRAADGSTDTVTIAPGEAFTITTAMIAAANEGHDVDENTTLTLTAQWTKTKYGVVFLTNGHGTAPEAQALTWGEPFKLTGIEPSAIPEDYEFLGWKLGGEGETVYGTGHTATYTMSYAEIPESDLYYIVYFVAQWKSQATTYTVTFASSINISAATMPEPLSNLAEGDTVDFTSSTIGDSALYSNDYATGSTNYRFLGWSLTQSATSGILYTTRNISTEMPTNVDFTKQTSYTIGGDTTDIVFYAIWARLYTITFDMNGGSASQAPDSQTNVYGKTYSLPSATRTDYTFNGWRQGSTSGTLRAVNFTWKFGSTATSSSVTLYASWTENTWYLAGAGGTTSWNTFSNMTKATKSGSTYTITATFEKDDEFKLVYKPASYASDTIGSTYSWTTYSIGHKTSGDIGDYFISSGSDGNIKVVFAGDYTFKITGTTSSASVTVTLQKNTATKKVIKFTVEDQIVKGGTLYMHVFYSSINFDNGWPGYHISQMSAGSLDTATNGALYCEAKIASGNYRYTFKLMVGSSYVNSVHIMFANASSGGSQTPDGGSLIKNGQLAYLYKGWGISVV